MFDLIIKNGTVIDGSGGARFRADVGVKGERIAAIGELADAQAREVIDASGLLLMPGFIDSHCHSDMALLHDRQHANGLHQGITSEILGQDGLSYAPLSKPKLEDYARFLAGLNGRFDDIPLDFETVGEYLSRFDGSTAVNAAYLVPHGAIRYEAMGFVDKPLLGHDMDKAKALLREGLEQGAVGFSTGLSYYPCAYADTDELVALCEVCAEFDVPFVIHLRSVFRGKPFDRVNEALEIARRAGCKLHFSHYRTRPGNEGRPELIMEKIERAMDDGQRITLELYPYYSGAGYAVVFLPPWAVEGGWAGTMERLANPSLRSAIIEGMRKNSEKVEGTFTHLAKNTKYIGMDFADVAKERGQDAYEMMLDILLEEELEIGYYINPTLDAEVKARLDADYVDFLKRPYYMIGSDSIPIGGMPHPRAFGAFARFVRLFRKHNAPFEILANRAAALPAATFGLKDRGMIKEGCYADIIALSESEARDTAEYGTARRAPRGIRYVVVNGGVAVYDEKVTGVFKGKAIKRSE